MSRRIIQAGRWRVRRCLRTSAMPVLALAMLLAGFSASYGAEQVGVRAGLHETFGRLVFDWSGPVSYKVATTDKQLTVTFDRPMEGKFDRVRDHISEYIGNVRLDGGGKVVVIDLKRPVQIKHFVNENSVVIDLRPVSDVAAAAIKTPPVPIRVPVRISNRNGYTRIVFDWPVRTDYHVTHSDGRVSLNFDRRGELVVPDSAASASPLLTGMQSALRDDGTPQVDLGVAGRVRHFRDGRKVVVDILANKDAKPGEATPPAVPSASPESKVGAPVQLAPARLRPVEPNAASLPDNASTLDVAVKVELDGVGLAFPFAEPTSMAAFRRGGWLWLVFDRPFRIDTSAIAAAGEFISAVEQLEHGQATVLRLTTTPGFNASVAREGNQWEVVIAPQLMRPETTLKVTANPGRDANVALGPTVPSTPLTLNDPEVGDQIFVVTVAESGHGLARSHQFSDFRLLPSVQGVAVVA